MVPHPILDIALSALRAAAAWQPATADELHRILASLHTADGENVLSMLVEVFDHLAETLYQVPELGGADRASAASWLLAASQHLGAVADAIDHARADIETGVAR